MKKGADESGSDFRRLPEAPSLIRAVEWLLPLRSGRARARPPSRGPNRDALHVIGKRTLAIIETLRPAPGKSAAHGEVDKVGTYALVSICETDGAVVVYDTKTLQGVERLPMVKRSGKYNVHNKVDRSRGTSH